MAIASDPHTIPGFKDVQPIDWEPRVGFAWDLFGTGKTVLRAMGGVYHAPRTGGGTTGGNLVNNVPQNRTLTIDYGSIDQLVNLTGTALIRPSSLNAVESSSHTPTSYNFSLGVQQDIGFQTVMEVSYVGSLSRHLGERRNINPIPDGAKLGTNNIDPVTGNRFGDDFLRPFRGYGDINMVTYSGVSNYHSLQAQANRRYSNNFQYGLAYTYSKSFDYANDDSSDVFNTRPYKAFNYAPSDFDQTHIFTVNYIWDVPGLSRRWDHRLVRAVFDNWQISGQTSFASGRPKNVSVTYNSGTVDITKGQPCPAQSTRSAHPTNAALDRCTPFTDWTGGEVNARPFMVCDPMKGIGGTDPTGTPLVINTGCFAPPTALGQIGNMPRNALRLPSIFNSDLAFFKNMRWGEKVRVQLRWETYNLFNHTNFRDIDAGLTYGLVAINPSPGAACSATNVCTAEYRQTNARFGAPTSARAPRVQQASIRINF